MNGRRPVLFAASLGGEARADSYVLHESEVPLQGRLGRRHRPDEWGWPPLNPTWLEVRQVYRSAPVRGVLRHVDFARALGLRSVVVRRLFFEGALPGAVQHAPNRIMVPKGLLAVAQAWGLARVRDWAHDRRYRSALE